MNRLFLFSLSFFFIQTAFIELSYKNSSSKNFYCSNYDNTFFEPCSQECRHEYVDYALALNPYDNSTMWLPLFNYTIFHAYQDHIQTDYYFDNSTNYRVKCKNDQLLLSSSCDSFALAGGPVLCNGPLINYLAFRDPLGGRPFLFGDNIWINCALNEMCSCKLYNFEVSYAISYDFGLPLVGVGKSLYCPIPQTNLAKRDGPMLVIVTQNQSLSDQLSCYLTEVGSTKTWVIHRDQISNNPVDLYINVGGQVVIMPYDGLDAIIPLPDKLTKDGGIISAQTYEVGTITSSCFTVIKPNHDKCDTIDHQNDFACLDSYHKTVIILFIIFFSLSILAILAITFRFWACFKKSIVYTFSCCRRQKIINYPVSAVYNLFTPLEEKENYQPIPQNRNSSNPSPFQRSLLSTMAIICCISLVTCCQNSAYLTNNNQVCTQSSNGTTCNLNTVIDFDLNGIGSSFCIVSNNTVPFMVEIELLRNIALPRIKPMYYTANYDTNIQTSCICDWAGAGMNECESCDGGNDVTLCDPDQTLWTTNYPSTQTFCTYESNGCGVGGSKVYSEVYYTINGTSAYEVFEITGFYKSSFIKITTTYGQTQNICYAAVKEPSFEACGIYFFYGSSGLHPISENTIYLLQYEQTGEFFVTENVNPIGIPSSCEIGILQMSTDYLDSTSSQNKWGQICQKSTISQNGGGGAFDDSCLSYQNFICCEDPLNSISSLPFTLPIGTLYYSSFNGENLLYFDVDSYEQVELRAQFNASFSFSELNQPVCPSVIETTEVTGTQSSSASFVLTALSTCFNGTAVLSCKNLQVMNPIVLLTTSQQDFIISVESNQIDVSASCTLVASSSASFPITGTLTQPNLYIGGAYDNTYNLTNSGGSNNNNNKNKNDRHIFRDVVYALLAVGIFITFLVLVIILIMAMCYVVPFVKACMPKYD